jgi:hypothetical protein
MNKTKRPVVLRAAGVISRFSRSTFAERCHEQLPDAEVRVDGHAGIPTERRRLREVDIDQGLAELGRRPLVNVSS